MPLETRAPRLPPPDSQNIQAITLNQVRPGPRRQNEYVESPGPKPHTYKVPIHTGHQTNHSHRLNGNQLSVRNNRSVLSNPVILNQPTAVSPPLKKDSGDNDDVHVESIICKNCGLCRCSACTEPQELPSRWCCGDKCELSAEKFIDNTSCFCAVKCAFYHCGGEGQDDNSCYEDPCACGPSSPHCLKRWTCISLMSICFPCLCCYWPERLCFKAFKSCYNKCRKKGCQCGGSNASKKGRLCSTKHSQTQRLLIESDSSSA